MNQQHRKFLVLRYHIAVAGYTAQAFGAAIGLTQQAISARLNGRTPWTVEEAMAACDVLELDYKEIGTLFKECRRGEEQPT